MNKVNVINPEIVVHGTLEKPYYEVQYYVVDDNAWKIGYSSYDLSIVCGYIRDYFNIIEQDADFQPIIHGRWIDPYPQRDIGRCTNCNFSVQDKVKSLIKRLKKSKKERENYG